MVPGQAGGNASAREHGREILQGDDSRIIELGSGSNDKLACLIASAGSRRRSVELHLIDVSRSALIQARQSVGQLESVRVIAHEAAYETGLERLAQMPLSSGRSLVLFLGSNIGNFDPPGRDAFMRTIRIALHRGDHLLLGADLTKPERARLLAYVDPLGVTAAFNRNLLARINRELQGTFDIDAFGHRAISNREQSRIEMHLVSRSSQRADIPGADFQFMLAEGETIWTESSFKYRSASAARSRTTASAASSQPSARRQ